MAYHANGQPAVVRLATQGSMTAYLNDRKPVRGRFRPAATGGAKSGGKPTPGKRRLRHA